MTPKLTNGPTIARLVNDQIHCVHYRGAIACTLEAPVRVAHLVREKTLIVLACVSHASVLIPCFSPICTSTQGTYNLRYASLLFDAPPSGSEAICPNPFFFYRGSLRLKTTTCLPSPVQKKPLRSVLPE
jgi:hypothetical protein